MGGWTISKKKTIHAQQNRARGAKWKTMEQVLSTIIIWIDFKKVLAQGIAHQKILMQNLKLR